MIFHQSKIMKRDFPKYNLNYTTMKAITIMKAIRWWYVVIMAVFISNNLSAQTVAPYTVSPKWMIGRTSGMSFPGPADLTGNPAFNGGQEATSTLCLPNKSIFAYCNNTQIYDGSNNLVQAINSPNGGQSSTQGAVVFPDPANPLTQAYIFSGDDQTGGTSNGVNWYLVQKTGATYSVISGPNNVAAKAAVNEGMVVGADGNHGYWVVSHSEGPPNQYLSWHVTASGVGATQFSASSSRGGSGAGGTIKISKCQTKIALIGPQEVEVYNWDKKNGVTGTLIGFSGTSNGPASGYSGEFSPDGNVLYITGLNGNLQQWDLSKSYATGLITITGSNTINGMMLGPDDKIYIARFSNNIAAVTSPNSIGDAPAGYTSNALTVSGNGPYIGLANEAWLNPNDPVINNSISCLTVNFSFDFKTYFLDDISVSTGSIEWNFGEGAGWQTGQGATPTHVYGGNGTYTVMLRFNDAYCTQQWGDTISINLSCAAAPVSLISFTGSYLHGQTQLSWTTATEINNDYFEVERSDDGINFYPVGKVKGNGSSAGLHEYELTDANSISGVAYYRLVQYDYNGKKTYSNVITLKTEKNTTVSVSPNPFTDNFTINFSGEKSSQIKVMDVLGRVVETRSMEQASYSLSVGENLSRGTYIVNVLTDQENYTYKMVKE
jgi:hypothetical protein